MRGISYNFFFILITHKYTWIWAHSGCIMRHFHFCVCDERHHKSAVNRVAEALSPLSSSSSSPSSFRIKPEHDERISPYSSRLFQIYWMDLGQFFCSSRPSCVLDWGYDDELWIVSVALAPIYYSHVWGCVSNVIRHLYKNNSVASFVGRQ